MSKNTFLVFDANFTFPDLRKCPRGGFQRVAVEFDFEVKNNKVLDPEAKQNEKNNFQIIIYIYMCVWQFPKSLNTGLN